MPHAQNDVNIEAQEAQRTWFPDIDEEEMPIQDYEEDDVSFPDDEITTLSDTLFAEAALPDSDYSAWFFGTCEVLMDATFNAISYMFPQQPYKHSAEVSVINYDIIEDPDSEWVEVVNLGEDAA